MELARKLDLDGGGSIPSGRDPEFIRRRAMPAFTALRRYFRTEMSGLEHLPHRGPFIIVGNHNGGPILADCFVMLSYWWEAFGTEQPAYALVHDQALRVPGVRTLLTKLGGIPATRENGHRVLDVGAPLLLYPGGDLDCLKSFWTRHTIDFHGRTGFVALALEHGVPIVPLVNAGGHEVYVTLFSSPTLARWTGIARLTRVKTVPVNLGLPWGIWATPFVPFLPLPAKFTYRVGPPIHLGHDPVAARDARARRMAAARVTRTMQALLDEMVARRRRPILG
jgi:1-acyl-sn-glycerol-3-phosphate acyltransferase